MEGSELFVVMGTHLQPVKGARPVVQVNYKISDNMVEWSDTYSVGRKSPLATNNMLEDTDG